MGIDPDGPQGASAGADFVTKPSRVKTGDMTFSMVTSGSGAFNLALSCHKLVYAWGDNQAGGCGQGPNAGNVIKYPVPVLRGETSGYKEDGTVGGDYLGGVTYIAASTNSGFAIMDDGRVVGWGVGKWNPKTGANAQLPSYIKFKDGSDVTNVTHISGGDDNLLIRTEDGKLYGVGPWNGGGSPAAVTYAIPVVKEEDGTPLTDIRMSAAGDVCGFAVTGDGYVWSWGNGGWGGSTGQQKEGLTHYGALKVDAGEYKTISGEEYLTDVKEVIGGRGHGVAVTKEGYMVYWGCNEGNGGVAPTDATTAKNYKSGAQGVKPVLAKYCDASGKPGEVVKNAVNISRGDNFDFMVNDKDEYYAWGLNDLGQVGTGTSVSTYNCLVKLETIPCEIQDNCPTVFMIDRVKCPGETIELDCGFVVPKGKEDRYYITWWHNGKRLNTSDKKDPAATRLADKYNMASFETSEPGEYKVEAEYIGDNIPCDACEPVTTSIMVEDMPMPIDTIVTEMNCVAEPLKPSAADNICFKAVVNGSFYKATQTAKFAAFSTETSKDTLETMSANGGGGELKFCVSGDKIASSEIHDNSAEESKDTTYTVWLEDMTSFDTYLYKGQSMATGGSFQSYGLLIDVYSDADLKSFDIYAKSYSGSASITVTPRIYAADKNENGIYVVGSLVWSGEKQTFTIDDAGPNQVTVKCGANIKGSAARGARYIIGMDFNGNCTLYNFGTAAQKENSPEFVSPVVDSEKFGIYAMGATANSYTTASNGSNTLCYANVLFGKLTDYDCGRIKLTARYGCPPCKRPDDAVTIEVDGEKHASANDTIFLCEESDAVELSVSGLTSAEGGIFDQLWFVDKVGVDASALQIDKNKDASVLAAKIAWNALKAGTTEKYYVKVRDNEKPEASACYIFDSIVVKYNEKPLAPAIDNIEFCENATDKSQLITALSASDFAPYTVNWYATADEVEPSATEPDLTTFKAQADPYVFIYSVTDKVTGCKSEKAQFELAVNEVPEKPITQVVPLLKGVGSSSIAAGATPAVGSTLIWYATKDLATPSLTAPLQDLSVAGTYYYWVRQKSGDGCEGDTATVTVVVNDAPMPVVRDTMLCVGSEIADLMAMVTPLSADYVIKWYETEADAKGTGKDDVPSFAAAAAGETKFYVSQLNTVTNAESEKATFSVKVFDVKAPTPDNAAPEYCIGTEAVALAATENTEGDYFLSSGLEWFDAEITASSVGSKNAFTPLTTTPGTKDYWVRQYYTLTTKDKSVCYGEPAKITVTVNETEKPSSNTNFTFNYLKTDAAAGQFADLLTKDPNGVIAAAGCELIWYSDAAGTQVITGTPAPTYDATQSGGDRQETFYVAQRNTATGCVSEIQKVIVNISDTPAPSGPAKNYCQDSPLAEALTADINTSVKSADKYELIWFTEEPNANPVKDATNGKTAAPVPDVTVPAGETEIERTYYVAQKDLESGAVSVATPITVMVYAKPVLTTHDASGFCFPDKVLLNNYYEYSSAVEVEKTFSSTFYDDADAALGGPEVSESGLYHVTGQFNVPVTGEVCISKKEDINVTIDKLEDLKITGTDRTCPRTSVTLTASSTQNTSSVSYAWSSTNNDSDTGASFASNVMSGEPGSKYTFTLTATAGTCTASVTHDVTIGDGKIEGNILISEKDNADWQDVNLVASDLSSVTVYTCGGDLTLDPGMVKTKGDFVWKQSNLGAISKDMGTGMITVKESGIYTVSYENECPTSVSVTVVAVPLTASASVSNAVICEETASEINLTYQCDEAPASITWTKDAVAYPATDALKLTFDGAKPEDSGLYVYTITNRGCTVTNAEAPVELTVKPYIKAAPADTFIVTRGGSVDMALDIHSPAISEISAISWREGASEVNQGAVYSLPMVERNAAYSILLSGEGYCDSIVTVQLYADAKLQLKTDLEDKVCKGDSLLFTVDTTGTGASYKTPAPVLTIVEAIGGVDRDITSLFVEKNGVLSLAVSPNLDAAYTITFTYAGGAQDTLATEEVKVLQAIEVELPDVQTVCEGSEVTIALKSVSPEGTTIEWESDPTITSGLTEESITVLATYNPEGATNNRSVYTYNFVATFAECGSKPMEIALVVDESIVGEVTGDDKICEGASTTLDASSFAASSYAWTADGDDSYAESGESLTATLDTTRTFRLSMTRGTCTKDTTYKVEVTSIPEITGVDSVGLRNRRILTNPAKGTPPFQFAIDSENETILGDVAENLTFTSHMAYVVDAVGCKNSFIFRLVAPEIAPKGIVTPEGDNINDTWEVANLAEVYPDAVVRIFDRYGKKLVEYKGADTGWDGTYNGTPMPTTDYWYEIEIEEIEKTYVGHFTLIRR